MKKTIRKLLDLKEMDRYSVSNYDKTSHYFFKINPYNLSVLSDEVISSKVFGLLNALKGTPEIEILALNRRENFDQNKQYLKQRIEEEKNPIVQNLLQKDMEILDQIQTESAASRDFLLKVQLKKEKNFETSAYLNRIEKTFSDHGFEVQRCNLEDLMTILAVYYEQDSTTKEFELIDGRRWFDEKASMVKQAAE